MIYTAHVTCVAAIYIYWSQMAIQYLENHEHWELWGWLVLVGSRLDHWACPLRVDGTKASPNHPQQLRPTAPALAACASGSHLLHVQGHLLHVQGHIMHSTLWRGSQHLRPPQEVLTCSSWHRPFVSFQLLSSPSCRHSLTWTHSETPASAFSPFSHAPS